LARSAWWLAISGPTPTLKLLPPGRRRCFEIAAIEEPQIIAQILSHLQRTAPHQYRPELPLGARAPPVQSRLP
jgi:hypothetical protein